MKCPTCDQNLVMSERQGIEIDYCPQCRGVWLDRGELDKIIEKSSSHQAPQQTYKQEDNYKHNSQPHYNNSDNHSHSYNQNHHKKKESWISDVFDF